LQRRDIRDDVEDDHDVAVEKDRDSKENVVMMMIMTVMKMIK
jgi:hypothetical protein